MDLKDLWYDCEQAMRLTTYDERRHEWRMFPELGQSIEPLPLQYFVMTDHAFETMPYSKVHRFDGYDVRVVKSPLGPYIHSYIKA